MGWLGFGLRGLGFRGSGVEACRDEGQGLRIRVYE